MWLYQNLEGWNSPGIRCCWGWKWEVPKSQIPRCNCEDIIWLLKEHFLFLLPLSHSFVYCLNESVFFSFLLFLDTTVSKELKETKFGSRLIEEVALKRNGLSEDNGALYVHLCLLTSGNILKLLDMSKHFSNVNFPFTNVLSINKQGFLFLKPLNR